MIIAFCGSTDFYDDMDAIQAQLESYGYTIHHPRIGSEQIAGMGEYRDPSHKDNMDPAARKTKFNLIKSHLEVIKESDAVLIFNNKKKGQANYIGGNSFLEMGFAFAFDKEIFILNDIPQNSYTDEITGMLPVVLKGDLSRFA